MNQEISQSSKRADWKSLFLVVLMQGQNAFNDSFIKLILIYAIKEATIGSALADSVKSIFSGILPIGFIILAPLAGFFSDRHSKRSVLLLTALAQIIIMGFICLGVFWAKPMWCVFGFGALAIQSVFVGPAKLGIIKELVGEKNIAVATSMFFMLTMGGIVFGMWLSGKLFNQRLAEFATPWEAILLPVFVVFACSFISLILLFFAQKTKAQTEEKFSGKIIFSHFTEIQYIFRDKNLLKICFGLVFYWFVVYYLGVFVLDIADEV